MLAAFSLGFAGYREKGADRPGFDNNLDVYAGLAAAIAKIDSKGGIEV
ncbi:MAG TPA: hypothetical protein VFS91_01840 [Nitrobacter sp.]|nr:hypothetical protein [Nitrobacter sp.]